MINNISSGKIQKINTQKEYIAPVKYEDDKFIKNPNINNGVASKMEELIFEMENGINTLLPNANFKYVPEYKLYSGNDIIKSAGWSFPKGENFVCEQIEYLKDAHGIENLVPFAVDEEGTCFACFILDGKENKEVQIIFPFAQYTDDVLQEKYDSITDWVKNGI